MMDGRTKATENSSSGQYLRINYRLCIYNIRFYERIKISDILVEFRSAI